MFSIILVAKNGELMTLNIIDTNNLFKKIGYKTKDDFGVKYHWNWFDATTNNHYLLQVWGKSQQGKKDNSNKYIFPPFEHEIEGIVQGKCVITCFCVELNKYVPLTLPLWDAFMLDKINVSKNKPTLVVNDATVKCKKNIINLEDIKTQPKEKEKRKQIKLKPIDEDDISSVSSSQSHSTKKSSKKGSKEPKQLFHLLCFPFFDANLFPEPYLE